jgi:hypothetical protein
MSYPWSTGDQLNAADLDDIALGNVVQLAAMESIGPRQPVAAGLYQATPIALDMKAIGTIGIGTTTISLNVGNHSNRLLVVLISMPWNCNAFGSSATFNGTPLAWTNFDSGGGTHQGAGVGYLVAPTVGTFNLVITCGNGGAGGGTGYYTVYSVYNASQSAPQAGSNFAFDPGGVNYTTASEGEVVFCFASKQSSGLTPTAGGAYSENTQTSGSVAAGGESGFATQNGIGVSVGFSYNTTGATIPAAIISISPATAVVPGMQLASSASANARSKACIGFSEAAYTPGQQGIAKTSGVLTGFTGLNAYQQYYLNDTNGTYGTSPGSVTRKIGIALSATMLLITNLW